MNEHDDIAFAELFDLLGITDSNERMRLSRHIFVAEALNEKELAKFISQLISLLKEKSNSEGWEVVTAGLPEEIYQELCELERGEYVTFDTWQELGCPLPQGAPIVIYRADGNYSVTRVGEPDAMYWKTHPLMSTTVLAVRPLSEAAYKELTKDGTEPIRRVSYDPAGGTNRTPTSPSGRA